MKTHSCNATMGGVVAALGAVLFCRMAPAEEPPVPLATQLAMTVEIDATVLRIDVTAHAQQISASLRRATVDRVSAEEPVKVAANEARKRG